MALLTYKSSNTLFPEYKVVNVTVTAGGASASSAADADLVGGLVVSATYDDTDAADKFINKVTLAADGAVTVALSGNTTNTMTVRVLVAVDSGNLS